VWRNDEAEGLVAKQQQTIVAPVIRVAPLGELRIYPITEAELDELERGSPASIHLNFALLFWGVAATLVVAILTTSIEPARRFYVFVIATCACIVAALLFSVLWFINHRDSKQLSKRIRERMPPPPAIQELSGNVQQIGDETK
jgi:glucan phosphoethanolaminetransferase (alkaline phosphatase superfamily)